MVFRTMGWAGTTTGWESSQDPAEKDKPPQCISSAWFHISSTTRCHGTARLLHTGATGSYSGHGGVISTNGLAGECSGWSSGGEWSPGAIASTIGPQRSIGVILRAPWESSTSSGSSAGHPRAPCGEQWTSSEEPWRRQPQQWQPPQSW